MIPDVAGALRILMALAVVGLLCLLAGFVWLVVQALSWVFS